MLRASFLIAAVASLSVSAAPLHLAPGIVVTTGPVRFTISADGKMVTLENKKLQRTIMVDVLQRCGSRAVGDPTKFDEVTRDTEIQLIYKSRCTLVVKMDASDASCMGCN
jgi:hypothetical protein